jgi:hypothetical protein
VMRILPRSPLCGVVQTTERVQSAGHHIARRLRLRSSSVEWADERIFPILAGLGQVISDLDSV